MYHQPSTPTSRESNFDEQTPETKTGIIQNLLSPPEQVGFGSAISHHGEIFQGAIRTDERGVVEVLSTMPSPDFGSRAAFVPCESPGVDVNGDLKKRKAAQAAQNAVDHILDRNHRLEYSGGILALSSNVPEGLGCGSSTTDCIAAVRAVADALDASLTASTIARLVVEAEGASDATMFAQKNVRLFAQHEATVQWKGPNPLPPAQVVAAFASLEPVPTDGIERQFPSSLLDEYESSLIPRLKLSVWEQDPELLGRVATRSLEISQRVSCKTPHYEDLRVIADSHRAVLGLGGSHSGGAVFFLLPIGAQYAGERLKEKLEKEGFGPVAAFRTRDCV